MLQMEHKGVKPKMATIVFSTCEIQRPRRSDAVRGMRSAFNLSGSTARDYHFAAPDEDADREAILNDWFAVNEDLSRSFDKVLR